MNNAVSWVCDNQSTVNALLVWFMGVVPVASVASWWAEKMPKSVQVVVQLLAMNIMHAVAAANPPAPPTPPVT